MPRPRFGRDEYLDSEVEAQRKAQETRRINDAVTAQYDALNKRLMQEPTINLGTDESPKTGIIQAVRRDGVIVLPTLEPVRNLFTRYLLTRR